MTCCARTKGFRALPDRAAIRRAMMAVAVFCLAAATSVALDRGAMAGVDHAARLAAATTVAGPGGDCPADLDGDGVVDGGDLGILLAAWGTAGPGDLSGNGDVGGADLGILLADWGQCPGDPATCDRVIEKLDRAIAKLDRAIAKLESLPPDAPPDLKQIVLEDVINQVKDTILQIGAAIEQLEQLEQGGGGCPPNVDLQRAIDKLDAAIALLDRAIAKLKSLQDPNLPPSIFESIKQQIIFQLQQAIDLIDGALEQLQPPPPPAACLAADHPCFETGGAGCTDIDCCAAVCAVDPFCCDTAWDSICVGQSVGLCGVSDCCVSHPGPGCDNPACQQAVCAIDPFCCDTQWDSICAGEAADLCPGCGAPFGEDESFGMDFAFSVDPEQLASTQLVVTDAMMPSAGNPSQLWLQAPIVGPFTSAIVTLTYDGPGSPQSMSVQIDNVTRQMTGLFGPVDTVDDLFPNVPAFSPNGTLAFSSQLYPIQVLLLGPSVLAVAKDEQYHHDGGPKIANKIETLANGGYPSTTWPDEKAALTGVNGLTAGDLDTLKTMRKGGDGTMCGDTTDSYNCHGRTFSCGMKWICNDQVDTILMKNGYTEAAAGEARVGDVCVFRDAAGDVIHTETVTAIHDPDGDGKGTPTKSTGKWGSLGEYVDHDVSKHPYTGATIKYWHSDRAPVNGDKNKMKKAELTKC